MNINIMIFIVFFNSGNAIFKWKSFIINEWDYFFRIIKIAKFSSFFLKELGLYHSQGD